MLASGALAATALRQQTLSIPIVFVQVVDPVSAGFVTNLARPEGNITGFTNFEFTVGGKWLQLLKECAPSVDRIAVVFDPANPTWAAYLRTIEAAAPSFGVRLIPAGVRDAAEITQRVATFARDPNGALIVLPGPVTIRHTRVGCSAAITAESSKASNRNSAHAPSPTSLFRHIAPGSPLGAAFRCTMRAPKHEARFCQRRGAFVRRSDA
jgi:putative tryptophan/tyrosine transport system substrate-binding protein